MMNYGNFKQVIPGIEGKVASILNSHQLIINVGKSNGVSGGMCFAVLEGKAQMVMDPDSHEILGSFFVPKTVVQVQQVQERMSIASVYSSPNLPLTGSDIFRALSSTPNFGSLKKSEGGKYEELTEDNSIVKIGDMVVQVQL